MEQIQEGKLNLLIEKEVRIFLKKDIVYSGKILEVNKSGILIEDKFKDLIFINFEMIETIEPNFKLSGRGGLK